MARRQYLLTSAACAALAGVVYLAVIHLALAQRVDLRVLEDAMAHQNAQRASLATDLVGMFDPVPFSILAGALVLGAVAAGRRRAGLAAAVLLAGANVTTELLKPLLAVQRPYPADHYMDAAAWPSGHTTAVVSLLLALVIVLPARLRAPAALLGGAIALVALGSIVLLGWHYPSDVLGGVLVASAWAAAAVALTGGGRAATAARRRQLRR
jgi:membrane-associated phospholipid phosphatase